MILLVLFTAAVAGSIGYYIALNTQRRKAQAFFDETIAGLQQDKTELENKLAESSQKLADTEYKLSETEKDCRHLQQQLERERDNKQTH